MNGIEIASGVGQTPDWSAPNPTIGSRPSSAVNVADQAWFDGQIAELLIFERTLTTAERNTVNGYLSAKFDLASDDGVPPTVVEGIGVTNIDLHSFSVSWDHSTDASGSVFYDLYLNGDLYGSTSENSYEVIDLQANTGYQLEIRSRDAHGNVSSLSSMYEIYTIDTIVPTAPVNLRSESLSLTSVGLMWYASSDNYGIEKYQIFDNGVLLEETTSTSFLLQGLASNTDYTLTIRGVDEAENVSSDSNVLSIRTLPEAPTNIASSNITPAGFSVSWSATASSNGIIGYEVMLDGQSVGTTTELTYAFYDLISSTDYTVEVAAIDEFRNSSEKVSISIQTLDLETNAPTTPSNLIVSSAGVQGTSLTWTASSDDSGQLYYQIAVNGVVLGESTESNYLIQNIILSDGDLIEVTAIDYSGNRSVGSAQITVTNGSVLSLEVDDHVLWLDASTISGSDGSLVTSWTGNNGNIATVSYSGAEPTLETNELNGRSVVAFTDGQWLGLPDIMSGASAGEAFYVVKASASGGSGSVSKFGIGGAGTYREGWITDFFGTTYKKEIREPVQALNQFNIYNSSSAPNDWKARINGMLEWQTGSNTVSFTSSPTIGEFVGEIAEIIVYDRILNETERELVNRYLAQKYALYSISDSITNLHANPASDEEINLTWSVPHRYDSVVFEVERKTGTESFEFVGETSGTGFTDSELNSGVVYTYRVRMRSLVGYGSYSIEVTANTLEGQSRISRLGMRLWLKADSIPISQQNTILFWHDDSGNNLSASIHDGAEPNLVLNELNSKPVVRFSSAQSLQLPDVMSDATAGEAFYVVKASGDGGALSRFGTYTYGGGGKYSTTWITDGFGTDTQISVRETIQPLDQFNIYHTSVSSEIWKASLNGLLEFQEKGHSVAFATDAKIGDFTGDIAEIIVFDRVLNDLEREQVNAYLAKKYALFEEPIGINTLKADSISRSEISLSWTVDNRSDPVVFEIERKQGGESYEKVAETRGTGYLDTSLLPDTEYQYRVRMRSFRGYGNYSEEVAVLTLNDVVSEMPKSGMRLWLKADDVSVAQKDAVQYWYDDSGNGNWATTHYGYEPTLVVDGINSRPVVSFTDDQKLSLTDVMSDAQSGEVFYIVRATGDGHNLSTAMSIFGTYGQYGGGSFTLSNDWINDGFGSTELKQISGIVHNLGDFILYNTSSAPDDWLGRINGDLLGVSSENEIAFRNDPSIGDFIGDIAEIVIFDRVLSEEERNQVCGYLTKKYDLFPVPDPINNLKINVVSSDQIHLGWDYNIESEKIIYEIERKEGNNEFVKVAETYHSSYFDSTLLPETPYTYRVRIRSWAGFSAYSEEISVETLSVASASVPVDDLRLWLKGSSFAATNGTAVVKWKDDSAFANDATEGFEEFGPSLVPDGLNGYPIVRFDSSKRQGLKLPNLMNQPEVATSAEIFAVVKSDYTEGTPSPLWAFHEYFEPYFARFWYTTAYPNADGFIEDTFGVDNSHGTFTPSAHLDEFNVYNVSATEGTWQVNLNDVTLGNGTSGPLTWTLASPTMGFKPGDYYGDSPAQFFNGDFAEVLIFDKVLSADERIAVRNYLNTKYALDTIDREDPTAPSNLASIDVKANEFTVSWTASTDDMGVASYGIYLDSQYAGETTSTEFTVTGLDPNTSYSVTVVAQDFQGNLSIASDPIEVTTVDTIAPSIPTGMQTTNLTSDSLSISWSASTDDVGVTHYEVYVNGVLNGTTTDTFYSITGLDAGAQHVITLRSADASGKLSSLSNALVVNTPYFALLNNNTRLAAGEGFSSVLNDVGSLSLWGLNDQHQVSSSTESQIHSPIISDAAVLFAEVELGKSHGLALEPDGSVWVWGSNASGQLGNGSNVDVTIPEKLLGVKATAVATGKDHSLFLQADGTVWGFGQNSSGQRGDGTLTDQNSPIQVGGLTDVVAIAAGADHSMAIKSDGTVWTWGNNSNGQLGDGTVSSRSSPIQVASISNATLLAAGDAYSLVVDASGDTWAFGKNDKGQLGDGTTTERLLPVEILSSEMVVSIDAGKAHSVAITDEGNVWAWGRNSENQINASADASVLSPVTIPNDGNAISIAAGYSHTLILTDDGLLKSLGNNLYGELGDGTSQSVRKTPVQIGEFTDVDALQSGDDHHSFILADGTLYLWGQNESGQLGLDTTTTEYSPNELTHIETFFKVSHGGQHTIALDSDGDLWAWGENSNGQLGDGSNSNSSQPLAILSIDNLDSIVAGLTHSLALKSDGTVYSWGSNSNGELGQGDLVALNIPTQVSGLSNVIEIAGGDGFSLALQSDGIVWAWGKNDEGQLGLGSVISNTSPVQVSSLSGITKIVAAQSSCYAIDSNGDVWAWGNNDHGMLGVDSSADYVSNPTQVSNVTNAIEVAAGSEHSLFLRDDGTIRGAGSNVHYQLGSLPESSYSTPQLIPSIPSAVGLSAGRNSSFVLTSEGTIFAWGSDNFGIGSSSETLVAGRFNDSTDDVDLDGLSDLWEWSQFGGLSQDGSQDTDLDGLSNIREKLLGTDPNNANPDGDALTDFVDPHPYDALNGLEISLSILSGDAQSAPVGELSAQALSVLLLDHSTSTPLANLEVTFRVLNDGGLLLAQTGSIDEFNTITIRTDQAGVAQVYFRQPHEGGVTTSILALVGSQEVTFTATSQFDANDTDSDSLDDTWEMNSFGDLNQTASGDFDSDGLTNREEMVLGTDPTVAQSFDTSNALQLQVWTNLE
ncbi:MAG: fibronectin type III domain-containing protein [Opitutales bacterium]|nr:fibronectin type III domain-containing protein [Opitutales bacterium]